MGGVNAPVEEEQVNTLVISLGIWCLEQVMSSRTWLRAAALLGRAAGGRGVAGRVPVSARCVGVLESACSESRSTKCPCQDSQAERFFLLS